jgi:uncharacterized membrane protein YfhO
MKKFKPLYFLSFIIPVSIMLSIFIGQEIFPFGDRSFLHIDMYHQYFPFLVEFYHKIKGGESLLYSWNTGIGTNFVALYAYYLASPFNWLCLLFPEQYLMEFLSYMVIFKIGLCSLSFTYYIRKRFDTESMTTLLFSLFYALSGYMAAYNWDVMWLDVIVLAPIVILGLEKLVYEGESKLYCIALGISILSNYYLSIMLCIFLCLYFIVLLVSKEPKDGKNSSPIAFFKLCNIKNFYVKAIIRFAVYSIIAGGIAAVLLIPEIEALKLSEFSDISFPSKIKTYFSIFDMIARHSFNVEVETGLDHWPNIYCGVAIFLLLPLYVIQSKIPMRQKLPRLLLIGFMLISFSVNLLNFIWHGFNYPDSLPARQSFLYIFLILTMCYEAFTYINEYSAKTLSAVFWGVLFAVILFEKLADDDAFSTTSFVVTIVFIVVYLLLLLSQKKFYNSKKIYNLITVLLIVTAIIESGANTYLTSVPTVSRSTYLSNYDSYQRLTSRTVDNEDGDFFRFEKFARRTQNDAMLIGFQGGSYFSSTINAYICDFYEKYGMRGSKVNYCFEGATPVTSALLSVRYMLYTANKGYDNIYSLKETEGNLYLYDCNYYLPLGYMVTEGFESDSDYSGLNPIEKQNELVHRLGIDEDVFIPVYFEDSGSEAYITIEEDAHYYAYTPNTKIDTVKMYHESESKSFSQIKKKYILDLGYYTTDDYISLNSENGETLNLDVYRVNESALKAFIDKLGANTMTVESYDETSVYGSIDVDKEGYLVMSIPYDPSWTLYVDGVKTDFVSFEDAFISVYLTEGSHSIELKYFPKGLAVGIVISILSIILFALLIYNIKRMKKNRLI